MNPDTKIKGVKNVEKEDFLYKELTHSILNAAFDVHNNLGCGFLEKVYENALLEEFRIRKLPFENQKNFEITYKGKIVGNYTPDIAVAGKVIVEVKACERIEKVHEAQLINYLKATGYEVGLILNFAQTKLEYKRMALSRRTRDMCSLHD